ncbi:MAG: hypothetical protein QNJ51_01745 [Calothrix sp. MO_167.B12]|nr:hypothetical protein [Calothrix sp. MO_167.B12]
MSAQLGSLVEKLVKQVEPRLNQSAKSETETSPKALPAELVEDENELLV